MESERKRQREAAHIDRKTVRKRVGDRRRKGRERKGGKREKGGGEGGEGGMEQIYVVREEGEGKYPPVMGEV